MCAFFSYMILWSSFFALSAFVGGGIVGDEGGGGGEFVYAWRMRIGWMKRDGVLNYWSTSSICPLSMRKLFCIQDWWYKHGLDGVRYGGYILVCGIYTWWYVFHMDIVFSGLHSFSIRNSIMQLTVYIHLCSATRTIDSKLLFPFLQYNLNMKKIKMYTDS